MTEYPELNIRPSEVCPGDVLVWAGSTSGAVVIAVEPDPEGTKLTIVWHSGRTQSWHSAVLGAWRDDEMVQLIYRYQS